MDLQHRPRNAYILEQLICLRRGRRRTPSLRTRAYILPRTNRQRSPLRPRLGRFPPPPTKNSRSLCLLDAQSIQRNHRRKRKNRTPGIGMEHRDKANLYLHLSPRLHQSILHPSRPQRPFNICPHRVRIQPQERRDRNLVWERSRRIVPR